MTIPYFILGILYLVALAIAAGFFAFNFYHLRRFGFFDFTAFVVTILTVSVATIVLIFSVIFLIQTLWFESAEVFGELPTTNLLDSF